MLAVTSIMLAQTENLDSCVIKEKKSLKTIGASYYGYKGANNYGIFFQEKWSKGWGTEMSFRSCFKKYGNYSFDLGINYSYNLFEANDFRCSVTMGTGFSYRFYIAPEMDKKGNISDKFKNTTDIFLDPRLCFYYQDFMFTLGYSLCSNEWRFGKKERADGLLLSIGYCI